MSGWHSVQDSSTENVNQKQNAFFMLFALESFDVGKSRRREDFELSYYYNGKL